MEKINTKTPEGRKRAAELLLEAALMPERADSFEVKKSSYTKYEEALEILGEFSAKRLLEYSADELSEPYVSHSVLANWKLDQINRAEYE